MTSLILSVLSLLPLLIALLATGTYALVAIAVFGLVAVLLMVYEAGVRIQRPANALTLSRALLACAAVLLAMQAPQLSMLALGLLILAEVTDFLDGLVARITAPSSFGGYLDGEVDAFFMLALSVLAYTRADIPSWVLLAGAARYLAYVPFLVLGSPSRMPRAFGMFAKFACAGAAILLLVSLAPPIPEPYRVASAGLAVLLLAASFGWEAGIRWNGARIRRRRGDNPGIAEKLGLAKSVLTYYGIPLRLHRMRRYYSNYINAGDLVFDLGAHVGSRVRAFRGIGAEVVAVEPQRACLELLRELYGPDNQVHIVADAVGATSGTAHMTVAAANPTLSTLSDDWRNSIDRHYADAGVKWNMTQEVNITTLDSLIQSYGTPVFIKLDIEGYEDKALKGLSQPVQAVSFEFLPANLSSALSSIAELERLGRYRYTYSFVERMRPASDHLLDADELKSALKSLPLRGPSGDVYAVLETPRTAE